ncbi:hypothetical protein PGTUg99_016038 [Puccinia graminis f. sp. tritici]|uniref:Uncharacterized protein n=1 Tax=Puccinia graminis f. sp. tritici TaxID=56615 RepID=A0A5B0LID3_PUCGR|nr:hypothetical protein PGTUg99_016038 [Puccinia graminis f. sp. tritici]
MLSNSPKSTYFSFPSYESHFISEVEEAPTPVTPALFQKALEPLIDCSAAAYPIIQRGSHLEAEIELILYLNAPRKPASLFSESSSSNITDDGSRELARHPKSHARIIKMEFTPGITTKLQPLSAFEHPSLASSKAGPSSKHQKAEKARYSEIQIKPTRGTPIPSHFYLILNGQTGFIS